MSSKAHGQEWLLRNQTVTFRAIGGSFDLYFLSGQNDDGTSSALQTISQFQAECVGLPAMQMFWTFGFHQTRRVAYCHVVRDTMLTRSRWGYENISVMEDVVRGYRDANIPLEVSGDCVESIYW